MINACQPRSERSRMKINHEKNKIMVFYETPAQRASRQPSHFYLTPRFPLSNPPTPLPLDEPKDFTYLSLKLDPQMTMQLATSHTCQKINWAYQTVSTIAHSLKNNTPENLRGTRTSPLIWQSCVLSHATQNLRYLLCPTQVQQVQSALISLRCFTAAQIIMSWESPPSSSDKLNNLSRSTSATQSRTHTLSQHTSTQYDSNAEPQTPILDTPSKTE